MTLPAIAAAVEVATAVHASEPRGSLPPGLVRSVLVDHLTTRDLIALAVLGEVLVGAAEQQLDRFLSTPAALAVAAGRAIAGQPFTAADLGVSYEALLAAVGTRYAARS